MCKKKDTTRSTEVFLSWFQDDVFSLSYYKDEEAEWKFHVIADFLTKN